MRLSFKDVSEDAEKLGFYLESHPGYYNVVDEKKGHRTVASGSLKECDWYLTGYAHGKDAAAV